MEEEDQLFEPSVDMMVNDFDDEQTLEEEENLARDPNQVCLFVLLLASLVKVHFCKYPIYYAN